MLGRVLVEDLAVDPRVPLSDHWTGYSSGNAHVLLVHLENLLLAAERCQIAPVGGLTQGLLQGSGEQRAVYDIV